MNTRLDRSKLNIGAYILRTYARSERHIKEIKDCGIDMIIDMGYDKEALDLFSKYNLGAIIRGIAPHWWGGCGKTGQFHKECPLELYDKIAKEYVDHPAIWSISIGDEPSALDLEHYGKVFDRVKKLFPLTFPYLNLYPNYATVAENTKEETTSQLGTKTYQEYIDTYCRLVAADYISYDYYIYATKNLGGCLENYFIVSDAARKHGKRFMYIAQVNSQTPDAWISEDQLRFQAFSAMSFGAEDITWACYTGGWWHNQVLDENGEKTQQYDKLKLVNSEIRNLADTYMKYKNTCTHLVGFDASTSEKAGQRSLDEYSDGYFTHLCANDSRPLIIGEMSSRDGKDEKALFITVADDFMGENITGTVLTFKSSGDISAFGKDGEIAVSYDEGSETYSIDIKTSEGYLIIAK